jgi:hypothetical protein
MSQLEYLIALISIIVGLGVTDLAQSVRELVRPSRPTRWHYLPLLWAGNVMLVLLQFWWASFSVLQEPVFGRPLVFLPYLLMFVALYLACAFALPDREWSAEPGDPHSGDRASGDPAPGDPAPGDSASDDSTSGNPAVGAAAPDSQARPDGPASRPSWGLSSRRPPLDLEVFYFSAGHRRWFFGILIGLVVIAQAVTASLYLLKGGKDLLPLLSVAGYNGGFIAALGLLIYSDREAVHAAVAVATLAALGYSLSAGVGPIG